MSGQPLATRASDPERPVAFSTASVEEGLISWTVAAYGSTAEVRDIRPMPGNSGYSFGFSVRSPRVAEQLVIRLPHPRASRQRNADVSRQADVLEAARNSGVPVPAVRARSEGDEHFGSPYVIVEFVAGRSTNIFDAERAPLEDGSSLRPVFSSAMSALVAIHSVDWQTSLSGWEVRDVASEIQMWIPTLLKSTSASWIDRLLRLGEALLTTATEPTQPVLTHGDFYSNNWLFHHGALSAVVDWELAGVGQRGLDLGWICMMYDRDCWAPSRHWWTAWSPTIEELVHAYESRSGEVVANLSWFRALASYRLACITAHRVEQHVSGKRHDPAWLILGDSLPFLVGKAEVLLRGAAA